MTNLSDKRARAIVTGAVTGLCAASAEASARRGASVMMADVSAELGEATAASFCEQGLKLAIVAHDAADADQWKSDFHQAESLFGTVNVLVNNTGINLAKTIEDLSAHEFRQVIEINLIGCFLDVKKPYNA